MHWWIPFGVGCFSLDCFQVITNSFCRVVFIVAFRRSFKRGSWWCQENGRALRIFLERWAKNYPGYVILYCFVCSQSHSFSNLWYFSIHTEWYLWDIKTEHFLITPISKSAGSRLTRLEGRGKGHNHCRLPSWIKSPTHNSARLIKQKNNCFLNKMGRMIQKWFFQMVHSTYCYSQEITPYFLFIKSTGIQPTPK